MLCQRCQKNPATHDICRETPLNVTHCCTECLTEADTEGLSEQPEETENEHDTY
jgi:protein-arginine kinase activator protein McsA